jgi:hypothetical protein
LTGSQTKLKKKKNTKAKTKIKIERAREIIVRERKRRSEDGKKRERVSERESNGCISKAERWPSYFSSHGPSISLSK